jgi:hypothetical protein
MCPWTLGCAKESFAFFEGLGMRTIAGAYYDADTLDDSKKWLDLERAQPHGIGIGYITWESKFGLMPAFGDMVSSPNGAIPAVTVASAAPVSSAVPATTTAPAGNLLAAAMPPANDPSWKPLLNGKDLTGWTVAKGKWQVAEGCVVGSAETEAGSRLDSDQVFGDCELTCSLYSDDCKFGTFQLRDWQFNIRWPFDQLGSWRTFRLVSKGSVVQASLDGEALKPQTAGKQAGAGKIRIYVGNPYSIKIKNLKVRSL